MGDVRGLRVLFLVEGFTDIRFVVGLSEMCESTMAVPAGAYEESTLKARVAASGARLRVHEVTWERLGFQARSLAYLWKAASGSDVILSQELLRGCLNASCAGADYVHPADALVQGGPRACSARSVRMRGLHGCDGGRRDGGPSRQLRRADAPARRGSDGARAPVLRAQIEARFEIERECTSPVERLGPQLGMQRWFIARRRTDV
jgi:hypothetical protein